jgi:3D (Asp-Asp-Asp) domain-containing protein
VNNNKKMSVLKKIEVEQTAIKKIRKSENMKGICVGLFLGLLIGVTYTINTIKFQDLWHNYQEALQIMSEHEDWKANFSGAVVTATAHAKTIEDLGTIEEMGNAEQLATPSLVGAIATTYNAEEAQTDGDPYTMASGHRVYEGAVASNCLPLGTKIEIVSRGTFTVEDRMNSRYTKDCGTESERLDIFKWERKDNYKASVKYRVL